MARRAVIPFLVAMMLLTGVCNTLLSKYQVCPGPKFGGATALIVSGPPMCSKLRFAEREREAAFLTTGHPDVWPSSLRLTTY